MGNPNRRHEDVMREKTAIAYRVENSINLICSGNSDSCAFKSCGYFKECCKPNFSKDVMMRVPLHRAKSTLKNINKHLNKANGRINPSHDGQTVAERVKFILGCYLWEHELIKNSNRDVFLAKKCKHIRSALQMLKIAKIKNSKINDKDLQ